MPKTWNLLAKLKRGMIYKAKVHTSKLTLVLQPISERMDFLNQQHNMMVNGTG